MNGAEENISSFEKHLTAVWRWARSWLPPQVADAMRLSAKRVVHRLGAITSSPATAMCINTHWPGIAERASDGIRLETFSRLVEDGGGRTLLDLGAGPCLFARQAVVAGWRVTAVDARTERVPHGLDGITFIQSDVREFETSGFDCIAILGLLYHLTLTQQEELLTACAYTRSSLRRRCTRRATCRQQHDHGAFTWCARGLPGRGIS